MEKMIVIVACVLIMILIPVIMKKNTWSKLMRALDEANYDAYYKTLNSFSCKMTFSAFDMENMRLSGYMSQNRKDEIEEQFKMMMNMRIKSKQKVVLGQRGFYYYLEQGKVKKARDMIDFVKANGPESSYIDLEMQYSILLKKESKYIDAMKEKINNIWDGKEELYGDKKMIVGTFQYLVGLQYCYINDDKNMMYYFEQALKNIPNTPYEENIYQIMKKKNIN